MTRTGIALFLICWFGVLRAQPSAHTLDFPHLANQWDEALPIGNGMLGALIWQKDDRLRFSLDRADLWDMRPMKGLHRKEFSYEWVTEQVKKKSYAAVQQYFDAPYDKEPAPSKIPGGALEFDTKTWGTVLSARVYLQNALCEVKWSGGVVLQTFVHATQPVGWFRLRHLPADVVPSLTPPRYEGAVTISGDPVGGDDLSRLGYKQGPVVREGHSITYRQQGWGGFEYIIHVRWKKTDAASIEGVWTISSSYATSTKTEQASAIAAKALERSYAGDLFSHEEWWRQYWAKSAIHIPDTLLERQWYLEQYKFGSVARSGAPPISLQGIWTADNGRLPPWKGDFHHDLNTQLSYWPCYSGNRLDYGLSYFDHLDANKPNYRRYSRMYFGKEGLAVPGVTTLDGTEMGGWIQYSLSPTVSSWLAQHYYLQWRYGMDKEFLRTRAYPWVRETAVFLENITHKDEKGMRQLPISSSPEINNNDISAWFLQTTNYDLSLMKFTFYAAEVMAMELGLGKEAERWRKLYGEFGDYSLSANNELMVSPTLPYNQSHRHFSNMMAVHPLGLIKWEDGAKAQSIIKNSLHLLDSIGPDYWCGYSYAWLASLKARAKDGKGADSALRIFVQAFCSVNSFHLNGDQTKSGYSTFQYRPFTLEGNFAFAAGIQEMLLQSYAGFIEITPAVPAEWKDLSFENLRTEGAFLVSVKKISGQVDEIKIFSEKGGTTKLKLPFKTFFIKLKNDVSVGAVADGFVEINAKSGGTLILKNGYE